jgi:hypothetical protein
VIRVSFQFGYVADDESNEIASVSPSVSDTGTALGDDVVTAFSMLGVTAVWVDGDDPGAVTEIAQQLGIASGMPADWVQVESAVEPQLNRAQRRALKRG